MKLVKPSFEEIKCENPLLLGEQCTRICYKSEHLAKEGSAKNLLTNIVKAGHTAMLEHITVYILYSIGITKENRSDIISKLIKSPYTKYNINNGIYYISTNLRVMFEIDESLVYEFLDKNGDHFIYNIDDNMINCKFEEYPEYFYRRPTIKFTLDRGGSQSFCRHRVFSFAQESTRWCNYIKDRFGNELSVIVPSWIHADNYDNDFAEFVSDMEIIEKIYFKWINKGYKAEEARTFLALGTKTEMVMTGFIDAWEHFFDLRTDKSAHPQARELANPLKQYFIEQNYIN